MAKSKKHIKKTTSEKELNAKAAPGKSRLRKAAKKNPFKKKDAHESDIKTSEKLAALAAEHVKAGDADDDGESCGDVIGITDINYTLQTTAGVIVDSLSIAGKNIHLEQDQDSTDPHKFSFTGSEKYRGTVRERGIQIVLRGSGKSGDSWKLEVSADGSDLPDNPIKEKTKANGSVDHNNCHPLS